jgi:hypothetical protein
MVLGHSLRDRGAKAKLAALVTVDSVSSESIEELRVCTLRYMQERTLKLARLSTTT